MFDQQDLLTVSAVQRSSPTGRKLGSVGLRYRTPLLWPERGRARNRRRVAFRSQSVPGGMHEASAPLARDAKMARVEAVLFTAREPIASRKLAQFAGLADGTQARTLVRRLNRLYDAGGSAFRAEEVAGGFQLLTRATFASWLRRVYASPVEVRLSPPASETLAVVAYRQPVLRVQIESIRGVDCGEILRQLMERDLVRILGRSEDLGRPYLYGTTKRFLQVFGLRHLDDLPRAQILRSQSRLPAAQTDSITSEKRPGQDGPKD